MRAAVCPRYGPPEVLQLREVKKPVPRDGQVLIEIHATTVTPSDCFIRSANRSAPLATQILMRLVLGVTSWRMLILLDSVTLIGRLRIPCPTYSRTSPGRRAEGNAFFGYMAYTSMVGRKAK